MKARIMIVRVSNSVELSRVRVTESQSSILSNRSNILSYCRSACTTSKYGFARMAILKFILSIL